MSRASPSWFIGIDPGRSGGICFLNSAETMEDTFILAMPETTKGLHTNIQAYKEGAVCYVEKLWGYSGGRNSAPSMFQMGSNYGSILMALACCEIPYDEIVPQRWQKGLGITPRGKTEKRNEFKGRLKQKAEQLMPGLHITLGTADAVLIAIYCQRAWGKLR